MASSLNPTHLLSVTWRLFECLDDKRGCRGDNGNFCLPILYSELHGYPQTIPVLLGLFGNVPLDFLGERPSGPILWQARMQRRLTTSGSKEDLDNGGGIEFGGILRQGEEKRRHREQYMTNRCSRPSRALITVPAQNENSKPNRDERLTETGGSAASELFNGT